MTTSKTYYVYILASKPNGTLYTGVTHSLLKRVEEHKNNYYSGFTSKYNVKRLVYFEIFNNPDTAIRREKCIKKWKRAWKIELIERNNRDWRDLYYDIVRTVG